MASNGIMDYLKNVSQSVKFAAIDVVSERTPNLQKVFNENNKKYVQEVYKDVSQNKQKLNMVERIRNATVFKQISIGWENLKDSIKTGKFKDESRETGFNEMELMFSMMGEDFLGADSDAIESEMNGEEIGSTSEHRIHGVPEVTKGDALVATASASATSKAASRISQAIVKSAELTDTTTRKSVNLQLRALQQQANILSSGFQQLSSSLHTINQFNSQVVLTHAQNSRMFFEQATALAQERNAILKEMLEMQRQTFNATMRSNLSSDAQDLSKMSKIFNENGFDLRAYSELMQKKMKESPIGMLIMSAKMLPAMIGEAVQNPLHYLAKMGIESILDNSLKKAIANIDESINGFIQTGLVKLANYGKDKATKNTLLGQLAGFFGLKNENTRLSAVDTSKYNKEAIQWNGIAQKALVEVIPGHLRRIEAALTGEGERVFDLQAGKWSTMKQVANVERDIDRKIFKDTFKNEKAQLLNMMNINDKESMRGWSNALDSFFRGVQKRGMVDYDHIKKYSDNYGDNENVVKAIAYLINSGGLDSSQIFKLSGKINEGNARKAAIIKNLNPSNQSLMNEATNNSYDQKWASGLGAKYKENGKQKVDNDGRWTSMPFSDLTKLSDPRGYTLYDYQYNIMNLLMDIRGNGGFSGGGGNRSKQKQKATQLGGGTIFTPEKTGVMYSNPIDKNAKDENSPQRIHAREILDNAREKALIKRGLNHPDYSGLYEEEKIDFSINDIKNANEEDLARMIAHLQYAGQTGKEFRANRAAASSKGIFSGVKSAAAGLGIDSVDSFLADMQEATSIADKFNIVGDALKSLTSAPQTILTSVLTEADRFMYEFMFGNPVGTEKDENGQPIEGFFGKVTNEFGKTMSNLNNKFNEWFADTFKKGAGGISGFFKGVLEDYFDIDIDEKVENTKRQIKKYTNKVKKGALSAGADLFGIAKESVLGTAQDLGIYEPDEEENKKKEPTTAYRGIRKYDSKFGLGIVGPGEKIISPGRGKEIKNTTGYKGYLLQQGDTVIPSYLNPDNAGRENITDQSLESQAKNENSLKDIYMRGSNIPIQSFASGSAAVDWSKMPGFLGDMIRMEQAEENKKEADPSKQKKSRGFLHDFRNWITGYDEPEFDEKQIQMQEFIKDIVNQTVKTAIDSNGGAFEDENQQGRSISQAAFEMAGKLRKGKVDLNTSEFKEALDEVLAMSENIKDPEFRDTLQFILQYAGYEGEFATADESKKKRRSRRNNLFTGINQFMATAFGIDAQKAVDEADKSLRKNLPELAKGGTLGLIASTILPLGGPLMGALVGAGASVITHNKSFQEYMFGKEIMDDKGNVVDRDNSGILSKKTVKALEKYMPDAKKYGITGALAGLILPFGPLGGMMIGAGASVLKNNQRVQDFLFGEEGGLINKDRKERIKRALPQISAATLGTLFLGPFGIVGNAMLGAGLGILSTTESFKRVMLGSKDRNGIRRGGLADIIRRQITDPFKKTMLGMQSKLATWFKDDLFNPLARTIKPFGRVITGYAKDAARWAADQVFGKTGQGSIGIFGKLGLKSVDKALGAIRNAGGLGAWAAGGIGNAIGSVAHGIEDKVGKGLERHAFKKGYFEGDTTAQERLDRASELGVNANDASQYALGGLDQVIAKISQGKNAKEDLASLQQVINMMDASKNGEFNLNRQIAAEKDHMISTTQKFYDDYLNKNPNEKNPQDLYKKMKKIQDDMIKMSASDDFDYETSKGEIAKKLAKSGLPVEIQEQMLDLFKDSGSEIKKHQFALQNYASGGAKQYMQTTMGRMLGFTPNEKGEFTKEEVEQINSILENSNAADAVSQERRLMKEKENIDESEYSKNKKEIADPADKNIIANQESQISELKVMNETMAHIAQLLGTTDPEKKDELQKQFLNALEKYKGTAQSEKVTNAIKDAEEYAKKVKEEKDLGDAKADKGAEGVQKDWDKERHKTYDPKTADNDEGFRKATEKDDTIQNIYAAANNPNSIYYHTKDGSFNKAKFEKDLEARREAIWKDLYGDTWSKALKEDAQKIGGMLNNATTQVGAAAVTAGMRAENYINQAIENPDQDSDTQKFIHTLSELKDGIVDAAKYLGQGLGMVSSASSTANEIVAKRNNKNKETEEDQKQDEEQQEKANDTINNINNLINNIVHEDPALAAQMKENEKKDNTITVQEDIYEEEIPEPKKKRKKKKKKSKVKEPKAAPGYEWEEGAFDEYNYEYEDEEQKYDVVTTPSGKKRRVPKFGPPKPATFGIPFFGSFAGGGFVQGIKNYLKNKFFGGSSDEEKKEEPVNNIKEVQQTPATPTEVQSASGIMSALDHTKASGGAPDINDKDNVSYTSDAEGNPIAITKGPDGTPMKIHNKDNEEIEKRHNQEFAFKERSANALEAIASRLGAGVKGAGKAVAAAGGGLFGGLLDSIGGLINTLFLGLPVGTFIISQLKKLPGRLFKLLGKLVPNSITKFGSKVLDLVKGIPGKLGSFVSKGFKSATSLIGKKIGTLVPALFKNLIKLLSKSKLGSLLIGGGAIGYTALKELGIIDSDIDVMKKANASPKEEIDEEADSAQKVIDKTEKLTKSKIGSNISSKIGFGGTIGKVVGGAAVPLITSDEDEESTSIGDTVANTTKGVLGTIAGRKAAEKLGFKSNLGKATGATLGQVIANGGEIDAGTIVDFGFNYGIGNIFNKLTNTNPTPVSGLEVEGPKNKPTGQYRNAIEAQKAEIAQRKATEKSIARHQRKLEARAAKEASKKGATNVVEAGANNPSIWEKAKNQANSLKEWANSKFSTGAEKAKDIFKSSGEVANKLKDTASATKDTMKQGAEVAIGKIRSVLTTVTEAVGKWFPGRAAGEAVSKYCTQIMEKVSSTKGVQIITKKLAQQASTAAAGAATLGIGAVAIGTVFCVTSFINGYNNAAEEFGVRESVVTTGMKVISGLVHAIHCAIGLIPIVGLIFSLIVSPKEMLDMAINYIGPAVGLSRDDLNKLQKSGDQIIENNAKVAQEYGKGNPELNPNNGSSFFDDVKETAVSAWEKVKNVGSSVWEGTKKVGSAIWEGAKSGANYLYEGAKNLYNKVTGQGKHIGVFGSGLHSQLDPTIAGLSFNKSGDTEKQTVRDSACGPMAMANALEGLGKSVDDYDIIKSTVDQKETNGGTPDYVLNAYANKQGVHTKTIGTSAKDLANSLKSGNPLVLMGQNNAGETDKDPYAENPHYVTAQGMDKDGNVIVKDPEAIDGLPIKKYKLDDLAKTTTLATEVSDKEPKFSEGASLKEIMAYRMKHNPPSGRSKWGRERSNGNAELLWNHLKSRGLSNQTIAGMLGNFAAESGWRSSAIQNFRDGSPLDSDTMTIDGNTGYGLAQWTYKTRQEKLHQFMQEKGLQDSDYKGQLDFILSGRDGDVSGLFKEMDGLSPEAAAEKFCAGFERPAKDNNGIWLHLNKRKETAREVFDKQGKGVTSGSTFNGGSSSSSSAAEVKNEPQLGGILGAIVQLASKIGSILDIFGTAEASGSSGGTPGSISGGPVNYQEAAKKIVECALAYEKSKIQYGQVNPPSPPKDGGQCDCSGMAQNCYKAAGIEIPRTADIQCAFFKKHNATFTGDMHQLKAGDLVFTSDSNHEIDHVFVYIGDGKAVNLGGRNGKGSNGGDARLYNGWDVIKAGIEWHKGPPTFGSLEKLCAATQSSNGNIDVAGNGYSGYAEKRKSTNRIIVHHTAGNAGIDPSAKEIDQMHKNNGWSGIGYHFVIRKNGNIERGRAEDEVGAHAEGANKDSIGIHVGGNFELEQPTPQQIESLVKLLQQLCKKYNIPIDRDHIKGHREVGSTACPGSNLFNQLNDIVAKAAGSGKGKKRFGTGKGTDLFAKQNKEIAKKEKANQLKEFGKGKYGRSTISTQDFTFKMPEINNPYKVKGIEDMMKTAEDAQIAAKAGKDITQVSKDQIKALEEMNEAKENGTDLKDTIGNTVKEDPNSVISLAKEAPAPQTSLMDKFFSSASSRLDAIGAALAPIKDAIRSKLGSVISEKFGKFSDLIGNPLGMFSGLFGSKDNSGGNSGDGSYGGRGGKLDYTTVNGTGSAGQAVASAMNCPITCGYGPRDISVGSKFHRGIDIGANSGTPVPTPVDGTIIRLGTQPSVDDGYGNVVILRDKKGYHHLFGHLSNNGLVTINQEVRAGDIIAKSGNTGIGTGPHLHYGIFGPQNAACYGDVSIDPMQYGIEGLSSKEGKGKYGRGRHIKINGRANKNFGIDYANSPDKLEARSFSDEVEFGESKSRFGRGKNDETWYQDLLNTRTMDPIDFPKEVKSPDNNFGITPKDISLSKYGKSKSQIGMIIDMVKEIAANGISEDTLRKFIFTKEDPTISDLSPTSLLMRGFKSAIEYAGLLDSNDDRLNKAIKQGYGTGKYGKGFDFGNITGILGSIGNIINTTRSQNKIPTGIIGGGFGGAINQDKLTKQTKKQDQTPKMTTQPATKKEDKQLLAPNGIPYDQNDIDYILNNPNLFNGAKTTEDAIKILEKDKKYIKKESNDNQLSEKDKNTKLEQQMKDYKERIEVFNKVPPAQQQMMAQLGLAPKMPDLLKGEIEKLNKTNNQINKDKDEPATVGGGFGGSINNKDDKQKQEKKSTLGDKINGIGNQIGMFGNIFGNISGMFGKSGSSNGLDRIKGIASSVGGIVNAFEGLFGKKQKKDKDTKEKVKEENKEKIEEQKESKETKKDQNFVTKAQAESKFNLGKEGSHGEGPNGKKYTNNDITYILNNSDKFGGAKTVEDAIKILEKDKKYTETIKKDDSTTSDSTDTGNSETTKNTKNENIKQEVTPSTQNTVQEASQPILNEDKLDILIAAQNKTNELLSAILSMAGKAIEAKDTKVEATKKVDIKDKKDQTETKAMTKLNYFYNNSMRNSGVDMSFFNPDSGDYIDISKRMQNIASM